MGLEKVETFGRPGLLKNGEEESREPKSIPANIFFLGVWITVVRRCDYLLGVGSLEYRGKNLLEARRKRNEHYIGTFQNFY